jgi:ribonuclease D
MFHEMPSSPELIESPEAFTRLVDDLGRQPRVAVDTESNSLYAFRERVCLVQFSVPGRDYVVDVQALDEVTALGSIFADPRIEKIFHAAEYDILCLRRDYSFSFANIFDTMQAGRILGRKMAGLDRLLDEKFGVKVNKRLQKANWGARPLSEELLQYAGQDTHYLIPLRDLLAAELEERGLLGLAKEDFQMACNNHIAEKRDHTVSPAWTRFSSRRDLTLHELTVLKELLDWRDGVAAGLDRPAFKVLSDETLVAIARARPLRLDEFGALGLGERSIGRWGSDLVRAVARGSKKPAVHRTRQPVPSAAYLKRLAALKEWRKKAAGAMRVESDVVLPRGLLLALAEKGAQEMDTIMRASPWRLQHFGDQISSVLMGVPSS